MFRSTKMVRHAVRAAALATVSLLAMPAAAQITTTTTTKASTTGAQPVKPMYGAIRPFYGAIRPFYGAIRPFYGAIRPFYGAIRPFEGDLVPFWGAIRPWNGEVQVSGGAVTPAYGAIRPFWNDIEAQWGAIRPFWGAIRPFEETPNDYTTLADQLRQVETSSQTFWGAAVQKQTGKSFNAGFALPLYAKYGIDLNRPETLQNFDELKRERFFLDWYDGLMGYSGADHVDHWMEHVNWTPALTQTQMRGTYGGQVTVGILDFAIERAAGFDTYVKDELGYGEKESRSPHGAGVLSLIASPHDGKGVMGVAPGTSVVVFNPFDRTGTASWTDITRGVKELTGKQATVVNMSLGVPDYTLHPGFHNVFKSSDAVSVKTKVVYVLAAGNDGVAQAENVPWSTTADPALILVGSVNPLGTISDFSNRPGTACLTINNACTAGNRLMDRFLVAPGEMLLVSDGKGGVTRMSGTSFATPLVSGTVALLQDRWPWLREKPKETVDIVLRSARDLGDPGVDAVYGRGLLDVTAAQSPLDFNNLTWKRLKSRDNEGGWTSTSAASIRQTTSQTRALWEADGVYYLAFETVGTTFRDFAVPLSSKLVGKTAKTEYGYEQFASYLTGRMTEWLGGAATTNASGGYTGGGYGDRFAQFTSLGSTRAFGAELTVATAPRRPTPGFRQSELAQQTLVQVGGGEGAPRLSFGYGEGATIVGGHAGFTQTSGYDFERGGANPVLGLASGGGFASMAFSPSPRLTITAGVTEHQLKRDFGPGSLLADSDRRALLGVDAYEAGAGHVKVAYQLSEGVELNVGATRLRERNALLGQQSLDRDDLAGGSWTDAMTLGGSAALGGNVDLSFTGTLGRTRSAGTDQQGLSVGKGGLLSSAYEVALTKTGVLGDGDRARVSFSQPMHLERGALDFTSIQVVDRRTGELGPVTQRLDLATGERPQVVELLYGRAAFGGEVSLFGRTEWNLAAEGRPATTAMVGGAYRLAF